MAKIDPDEARFHQLLQVLATHCNFDLNVMTIALYDEALGKYGYRLAADALKEIFNTRRGGDRFPSVADIREKIGLEVSDKALAVDCANLILSTLNKWRDKFIGREDFEQLFREMVGDLPWTVVERMGGYRYLYREWSETDSITTFRAQLREAAMSAIELIKAGHIDEGPLLAAPQTTKQIGGKNE